MLDFDFFSSFRVFPFGLILFDALFLLVAIPIEAYILNKRLNFDKRTSTFYSISMNVFSNAIGWIIFFLVEPTDVFNDYKVQLINFLLYNRINGDIYSGIVLAAFITFFGTLMVKFALLRLVILALSDPGEKKAEPKPEDSVFLNRKSRRGNRKSFQGTSLFTTTLIANSLSYTAITLIVIFRFFARASV
jgi:hypothetical protein